MQTAETHQISINAAAALRCDLELAPHEDGDPWSKKSCCPQRWVWFYVSTH